MGVGEDQLSIDLEAALVDLGELGAAQGLGASERIVVGDGREHSTHQVRRRTRVHRSIANQQRLRTRVEKGTS